MLDQTAGWKAKGPRVWEFLSELARVLDFVLSCLGSPARGQRCIVRRIRQPPIPRLKFDESAPKMHARVVPLSLHGQKTVTLA